MNRDGSRRFGSSLKATPAEDYWPLRPPRLPAGTVRPLLSPIIWHYSKQNTNKAEIYPMLTPLLNLLAILA